MLEQQAALSVAGPQHSRYRGSWQGRICNTALLSAMGLWWHHVMMQLQHLTSIMLG